MSPHIISASSRSSARGFFLVMLVAALVVTVVCGTTEVKAAAPAPAPIGPAQTTIVGVDPANMTVTITLKHREAQHVYKVDDATRVKVNDVTSKLAGVHIGQIVTNFVERDSSALDVLEVTGNGAAPTASVAPAKPKPAR